MDGENLRLEALENHIRRIERRLERLEAARLAAPAPPEARASAPPPHPLASQAATPTPAAPPAAPVVASIPASEGWQSSTWWTSPEPKPTAPPTAGAMAGPAPVPEPRVEQAALPEVGDGWGRRLPRRDPPGATASATASAPRPALSLRDLEERFAGRALAWVGGLALVAAAVFFLSLAFSRGWINEPMRVMIGLGVGIAAFAGGAAMLARHNRLMGNVLSAVGLGIISIALFAATRLYGLVPPEVGLAGALVAAIAAAVIAIRFDAKEVAAFGLIAALVAPPVVGASPTTLTLLFVAVTLVGTTAIALFRTWPYLPPLAFILAAPQLASWLVGDPVPVQAIIALAGFWLVNVVAAAGEETRIRRDDLRPSSATLVLANATFLLWGGFVVLDGDLAGWFGTFIALASLAHLLLGGWFLARQGFGHLFGNLVAGTGVALLAIAAFVQLGAAVVPLAWAAEAVALAWLAVRRRHEWSAAAALVLGSLVVTHLLVIEYPLWEAGLRATPVYSPPFLHPEAGSLVAVLAAIAVAVAIVPVRWIRSALAATGVVLAAYGVTFELAGPYLAAALTGLALAGLLLDRLIERLPVSDGLEPVAGWVPGGWLASASSLFAGGLAILLLFVTEYPPSGLGDVAGTPFINPAGASLALVLAGLAAAGALVGVRWVRSAMAGIGILLVAWAAGSEVEGTGLIGLLALLAVVGLLLDRLVERLPADDRFASLAGLVQGDWLASLTSLVTGGLAVLLLFVTEYPPSELGVVSGTPFVSPEGASLALVLAGLAAAGALVGVRWVRSAMAGIGILLVAWAAGFEVEGTGLVGLLAVLLPIGVIIDRGLRRLPEDERFAWLEPVVPFDQLAGVAGVVAWACALVFALSRYLDPITWGSVTPPPVPFTDDRALAAALLAASALAAARWTALAVAPSGGRDRRGAHRRARRSLRGVRGLGRGPLGGARRCHARDRTPGRRGRQGVHAGRRRPVDRRGDGRLRDRCPAEPAVGGRRPRRHAARVGPVPRGGGRRPARCREGGRVRPVAGVAGGGRGVHGPLPRVGGHRRDVRGSHRRLDPRGGAGQAGPGRAQRVLDRHRCLTAGCGPGPAPADAATRRVRPAGYRHDQGVRDRPGGDGRRVPRARPGRAWGAAPGQRLPVHALSRTAIGRRGPHGRTAAGRLTMSAPAPRTGAD